jgi:hypothetical protein
MAVASEDRKTESRLEMLEATLEVCWEAYFYDSSRE